MMYRVMRPKYEKTGKVTYTTSGETIEWNEVAEWIELGVAESMEDAYARFPRGRRNGYSHVLEEIKIH